jgi:RNA polymerase sigma factor (sigma-70 family)
MASMANGQAGPVLRFIRTLAPEESPASDRDLLTRFTQHGEDAAFAALVQRHGPLVLGVCRRVLREAHDCEDAFQATFLVLLRKAASIRRPELLGNWLYGVAYRTALRARVEQSRRRLHEGRAAGTLLESAEHDLGGSDFREVLDEEIHRLPEKYRTAFVLCYLEGKTNVEAARSLRCPKGTVLSRLARARQRLRSRLSHRGIVPSCLPPIAARLPVSDAALACLIKTASSLPRALGPGIPLGNAAHLAKGVLRSMFLTKVKAVAVVVLGLALGGVTAGLLASPSPAPSGVPLVEKTGTETALLEATHPEGWGGGSSQPGEYEITLDRSTFHGGSASGSIHCVVPEPKAFGTLTQAFRADDYRGKRLQLSGYLKTDKVAGNAGLWVRIDARDKTVGFDNMQKRPVKGTADWKKVAIVLDVPEKSVAITFGAILHGTGRLWVDDLRFEVVGAEVATTNMLEQEIPIPAQDSTFPEKPVNLDFEGK